MATLSDKAMRVRLSIAQWTARKLDKAATSKLTSDYGAESDAARVNKLLIADAPLKKIQRAAGDARTFHYAHTLPWEDDDWRLETCAEYAHYTTKMRQYHGVFDAAVSELIGQYPALLADAPRRLNGLFNPADYPDINELPHLYRFSVAVSPIAGAEDFRVALQDEDIRAIRADIEIRQREAEARAMRELWQRLFDSVKHLADKLGEVRDDGKQGIFRDSLVSNVADLCDLLPRLNVLDDPQLDAMRAEVLTKLASADTETLRKDPVTRIAVATDAQNILAAMSGYMGS